MKIVIDIPEWKYKSICEGIEASKRCGVVGIDPDIHEAIYNGKPYEETPQGDLISRSALKIAIREATYDFEEIPIRVDKVIALIDNSPTINSFCHCEARMNINKLSHKCYTLSRNKTTCDVCGARMDKGGQENE